MRLLHLTLTICLLSTFSSVPALKYASTPSHTPTKKIAKRETTILFQSKDGGLSWQDVSQSLPAMKQPDDFFAGESDLYLLVNNIMYHSKGDLKTPVWKKDNFPHQTQSLAFNPSGLMAYNYYGNTYQRKHAAEKWAPIYSSLKKMNKMRMIFETADGTLFFGSDSGLYKSEDSGQQWRQVQNEGWVMEMVESNGVLMATGQKGIMRSTDKGEHWEWVINEGGVGIDIEKINGGFAAIAFNTITQTRRVHISLDGGKTWEATHYGLQPSLSISSIKQMGNYLICGHPNGIFRSADRGKTWDMVHPGVEEFNYASAWTLQAQPNKNSGKVYKIYVSGNTLYAVMRNFGC